MAAASRRQSERLLCAGGWLDGCGEVPTAWPQLWVCSHHAWPAGAAATRTQTVRCRTCCCKGTGARAHQPTATGPHQHTHSACAANSFLRATMASASCSIKSMLTWRGACAAALLLRCGGWRACVCDGCGGSVVFVTELSREAGYLCKTAFNGRGTRCERPTRMTPTLE